MKNLLFLAALLLTVFFVNAQKPSGAVIGTLKDSANGQGLHNATVSVLAAKDSSLISYTLTSRDGYFEIKNITTGNYILSVSYQGYQTLRKTFTISEEKTLDLATVHMVQDYKMLDEIVIKNVAPVIIKEDTIAFNADAFKTLKPNATAEDLLKRLPGIQVEKDGTVKAQGENVQKIYVDGKEFFANDPQLATKNITADMIDQVELYDDMSEQAKFSGVDDGSRTKAINIKLKKDKKKGVFGRAGAGYGSDERYEANLSANYFKGDTKLSIVARSNNANNIGFTSNDQAGVSNGTSGSGSGIRKNSSAGINYSDVLGKRTQITSSYLFNSMQNINVSRSYRQTFFPDSINRLQEGHTANKNGNHRINLRLTHTIDSLNSFVYTPNISFQNSESSRSDSTESFRPSNKNVYKINDSRSIRNNMGEGINWTNNLTYRRKFAKRGRTFSVSLSSTYSSNNRDGSTNSRIGKFSDGVKLKDSLINQINSSDNSTWNYGISISYTEPIAKDKFLEFNYGHNQNKNESDRQVYDLNNASGNYDIKNPEQTNLFQNENQSHRVGTNFRVVKKKYNYQVGIAAQRTLLASNNLSKNNIIEQTFTNLFPTASFNYQFARSKNLRISYRGRTEQPGVTQLQPIRDVSNPLYQTEGNPFLKQEYSNNLSINYNFFNPTKLRNIFFRINFSNTYNKIVNSVSLIDTGVQLSRPENANGAYNVNGNFNVGFPINRMKGGNFNTSTTVGYSRNVSLANNVRNFTKNLVLGETLRLNYNFRDKLDASVSASINYNAARYTLIKNQNTSFVTYAYSADISYLFPFNFTLSTDVDYTTQKGLSSGFNQQYLLWNASLSRQFLKNNRGQIKLSVFDILRQNRSISRNFTDNYIDDVQNTVLQRFLMLTFTYNLNRMGSVNNRDDERNGNRR